MTMKKEPRRHTAEDYTFYASWAGATVGMCLIEYGKEIGSDTLALIGGGVAALCGIVFLLTL